MQHHVLPAVPQKTSESSDTAKGTIGTFEPSNGCIGALWASQNKEPAQLSADIRGRVWHLRYKHCVLVSCGELFNTPKMGGALATPGEYKKRLYVAAR